MGFLNILAIDGGGIRGIYAAHLLDRIQKETGINYTEHFDLIAGTSTGSIIASALAINYPISDVVSLYDEHGDAIFSNRLLGWFGALLPKYSNKALKNQLHSIFTDKTLSDTSTNLMIPATDIGNGSVHVFKSPYDSNFVRDKNVLIADAVLASCSAPSFFKPHTVNEYLLADGGLWANNPSLTCLIEAKKRFNVELDDVKLLSIGSGIGHHFYDQKKNDLRGWGILTGWGGPKLLDTILNLQSESTKNMTELLLKPDQSLRINFEVSGKLALDDTSSILNLKSKADRDFTHNAKIISKFLLNDKPKEMIAS